MLSTVNILDLWGDPPLSGLNLSHHTDIGARIPGNFQENIPLSFIIVHQRSSGIRFITRFRVG